MIGEISVNVGGDEVRKACLLLVAVAMSAMTWWGAGNVTAEPQLPRVTQYSENVGTFGDHDFCHGAFNIGMVAPKGKRGVVRITLTSFGFTGNGSGWARDPKCRFFALVNTTAGFGKNEYFPVAFGRRPGERVTIESHPGSGPKAVTVSTSSSDRRSDIQSFGATMYTIVP
ncbi:enoyl-CoA hydratase [Gordonia sp. SID5947]|uniref:enoyl-CoA hydratase n=1 Tax=Gordonia sp. SID5947 TaxID=2690315 RepID=UPI00136CF1FF|nr:enoyl-CoA hydratase [Gordonia sp. SID5947]MYR07534.1 enoyl-CoA hydratase [Gordonia sp. SID5947]